MSDSFAATACCTALSYTVGIPSGLFFPSGFGMYTRLTGLGLYLFSLISCAILPVSDGKRAFSSSTFMPSMPAAPFCSYTCIIALSMFFGSRISSIRLMFLLLLSVHTGAQDHPLSLRRQGLRSPALWLRSIPDCLRLICSGSALRSQPVRRSHTDTVPCAAN